MELIDALDHTFRHTEHVIANVRGGGLAGKRHGVTGEIQAAGRDRLAVGAERLLDRHNRERRDGCFRDD